MLMVNYAFSTLSRVLTEMRLLDIILPIKNTPIAIPLFSCKYTAKGGSGILIARKICDPKKVIAKVAIWQYPTTDARYCCSGDAAIRSSVMCRCGIRLWRWWLYSITALLYPQLTQYRICNRFEGWSGKGKSGSFFSTATLDSNLTSSFLAVIREYPSYRKTAPSKAKTLQSIVNARPVRSVI